LSDTLQPEPLFSTSAPSWIDVSLRRKGNCLLIHFVNQNPGRDISLLNTDDTWVDEIPEVGPHRISLRIPASNVKAVSWEPGHHKLSYSDHTGALNIEVPRFKVHGCVKITGNNNVTSLKALC